MTSDLKENMTSREHGCLRKFLVNLHEKSEFKFSPTEILSLGEGVQCLVEKAVNLLQDNEKFCVQKIIHVGSSYDGSRVISPDEYDYMLVLEKWSKTGCVRLTRGCQDGKKTLRYADPNDIPGNRKSNIIFEGILGLEMGTAFLNSKAYEKLKHLKCKIKNGHLCVKEYGNLTLYINAHLHTDFLISVDIMPAVKLSWKMKEVRLDLKYSLPIIKQMTANDGCYFVGKRCCADGICWQQSFAVTESRMIRNMTSGHMKIFRVLKYLFDQKPIIGICDVVTSYVLKTAVLQHTYFTCKEGKCACECFVSVLLFISSQMDKCFLGSFFIPSLNIWQNLIETRIRNITENQTICDATVRQCLGLILKQEDQAFLKPAMICIVLKFWKRVFQLLADIFCHFHTKDNNLIFEGVLKIIYCKLNEEDEDDDIDTDYFSVVDGNCNTEIDWKIAKSIVCSHQEDNNAAGATAAADDDDDNDENSIDMANEDFLQDEEEKQDAKDFKEELKEALMDTARGDNDSDDEYSENDDEEDDLESLEGDCFCQFGSDWFLQATAEDVYYINDKYYDDLNDLAIPVFSELHEEVKCFLEKYNCNLENQL